MDAEANRFAMELLMPENFVRTEVRRLGGVDIDDNGKINQLAKKFQVTRQAMAFRLGQLQFGQ